MNIKELFLKILEFSSRILNLEKKSFKNVETSKINESIKIAFKNADNKDIDILEIEGEGSTTVDLKQGKICINSEGVEYTASNGVNIENNNISLDDNVVINAEINQW